MPTPTPKPKPTPTPKPNPKPKLKPKPNPNPNPGPHQVRLSAAQATLRESGGRITAERAALRGLTAKPSAPGASKPRLSTAVLASEVLLHLQT